LVGLLAAYREEDLALFPEVYVFACESSLQALPSVGDRVVVGREKLGAEASATILKNCAPLASSGWSIFAVKNSDQQITYGLFRSGRHSLSTGSDEAMVGLGRDFPIILIRNRGHLVVELRNTMNGRFTASLRTTLPKSSTLEDDIDNFALAATRDLQDPESFRGYLRKLLIDIVQHCHGTLLGVIAPTDQIPESLQDGVWPGPRLKISELYYHASQVRDADSLSDLKAVEVLLAGMIGCDGIVVFGSDGTVLAYRIFIKPSSSEAAQLPTTGGGRRRTFELMKLRMPCVFQAILFRSQDGDTACNRSAS